MAKEGDWTPWGKAHTADVLIRIGRGSIVVYRTGSHGGMRIPAKALPSELTEHFYEPPTRGYVWAEEDIDESNVLVYLMENFELDEITVRSIYGTSVRTLYDSLTGNRKYRKYDTIGWTEDEFGVWAVKLVSEDDDYENAETAISEHITVDGEPMSWTVAHYSRPDKLMFNPEASRQVREFPETRTTFTAASIYSTAYAERYSLEVAGEVKIV